MPTRGEAPAAERGDTLTYGAAVEMRRDLHDAQAELDRVWRQEGHSDGVNRALRILMDLEMYTFQHTADAY